MKKLSLIGFVLGTVILMGCTSTTTSGYPVIGCNHLNDGRHEVSILVNGAVYQYYDDECRTGYVNAIIKGGEIVAVEE